jgi:hypothetical protein
MRIHTLSRVGLVALGVLAVGLTLTFTGSLALAAGEPLPETPVTLKAEAVTGATATLKGELNPNVATKDGYYFTYDTNGTCEPAFTTTPGPETTETKRIVSTPVDELEGSTTYTFCVIAANAEGQTASGSPLSFKTPNAEPLVTVESVSGVTPFDGVLEGQLNTEKQETSYHYEYSTEKSKVEHGEGTRIGGGSLPGTSQAQGANPADIGGSLTPNTTYYYRLIATDGTGTTDGRTKSFTTSAFMVPVVEGESLTTVGQSTASLSGLVNPEFQPVLSCEFVYVASGPPLTAPCIPSAVELGAGSTGRGTAVNLEGLAANMTYHYKILTGNKVGVGEGPEETFTTLPTPPLASTGGASEVTTYSASVTGTVNPNNGGQTEQDNTRYYFEYGQDTSYGKRTFPEAIGEGLTSIAETATLGGLASGRTYHYRIVASNNNATAPQLVYGQDEILTTLPPPLSPAPPGGGLGETPTNGTAAANTVQIATMNTGMLPNLTAIMPIPLAKELGERTTSQTTSSSRAQKLTRALRACKKAGGAKRARCERHAHARYGKTTKRKGK